MSEVTDLLRAEGIPDSLLMVLAGMPYCMHKCDNYMLLQH